MFLKAVFAAGIISIGTVVPCVAATLVAPASYDAMSNVGVNGWPMSPRLDGPTISDIGMFSAHMGQGTQGLGVPLITPLNFSSLGARKAALGGYLAQSERGPSIQSRSAETLLVEMPLPATSMLYLSIIAFWGLAVQGRRSLRRGERAGRLVYARSW